MKEIKLGYEIKSGKKISIPQSHLIVTGITQLSGKTTTLEALIKRSGVKAIVFKTKVGELGFTEGTIIPPYFFEKSDWEYVSSLLEATMKEKMRFERAWIIEVCKNADTLLKVKSNIDEKLAGKLNSLSRGVYTTLSAYFDKILPQLQYATFSRTLTLNEGINIMDLERFTEEIQSLVIRSVLETVLKDFKNVVIVMPEAWKYIPQERGNPCKHAAEAFIRQGATNGNYLWIDSQDMANVDKTPMKQISTWILGLQQERNEVIHTLDQVPLSKRLKPKPEEIMTLKVGHFFVCTPQFTAKVYVQPAWVDDETAKNVALGKKDVKDVEKPKRLAPFSLSPSGAPLARPDFETQRNYARLQQDMIEMRQDFFNKTDQLQQLFNRLAEEVTKLQMKGSEINYDDIVSRVLQKMPTNSINKQELVSEVLKLVPRGSGGSVVYEVAPLEKIQKDFLEEAKQKVISDITSLSDDAKKVLKYLESRKVGCTTTEITTKGFMLVAGGGNATKINNAIKELVTISAARKDAGGKAFGELKKKISDITLVHGATEPEIEQVYNHVIAELLK